MHIKVTCDETNNTKEDIAEGKVNVDVTVTLPKTKLKKGFAVMDPAQVRQLASMGGKAAHAAGTAHQFTSEKAREAGRKGGKAFHKKRGRGKGDER